MSSLRKSSSPSDAPARYAIRTVGCQMNVHDSEKIANLLHHAGFAAAASEDDADLLILNTCSIRDKAEHHLYSDLGTLREWKAKGRGRAIGVGGCVAQQVGDGLLSRFGHLDFVFGTHNLRLVPSMARAALGGQRSANTEESRSLDRFDLPHRHASLSGPTNASAFLTVMEGCDMFCTFCIVPTTRGREISRPAAGILAEARDLAARGVRELTLLGQTVNAYGRHDVRRGKSAEAGTMPFAELLAEIDAIPGIDRIRYTSPHPLFFDDALCRAHGELESLCPHVHLPAQSGSTRVLEAMRRRYSREEYLEVVAALRSARPDIAITSDLIVGFPGETHAEFEDTLSLVEGAELVDSYSFKYSPRPGTAAADMAGATDPGEAQARLAELQALQRNRTLAYHRSRVGTSTEILVEGPSRKAHRPGRSEELCGRDPYHRVVNVAAGAPNSGTSAPELRPGHLARVEIAEATPHSLIGEPPGSGVHAEPERTRLEIRSA